MMPLVVMWPALLVELIKAQKCQRSPKGSLRAVIKLPSSWHFYSGHSNSARKTILSMSKVLDPDKQVQHLKLLATLQISSASTVERSEH
jgi:hypothetical protein